eukprot:3384174-Pleurochrysis_carterae.AAC.1
MVFRARDKQLGSQSAQPASPSARRMSLVCLYSAILRAWGLKLSHFFSIASRPACPRGRPITR